MKSCEEILKAYLNKNEKNYNLQEDKEEIEKLTEIFEKKLSEEQLFAFLALKSHYFYYKESLIEEIIDFTLKNLKEDD